MPDGNLTQRSYRIAMLIDGDNAQASLIDKILMEASKHGTVIVRRIYGDWANPVLSTWLSLLPRFAIQPMQQSQNTTGKNSTDIALIIDAMDLLYQGVVDSFCLVSSDSDFTRLATRLRESGSFVIGIGKRMTPATFVAACDVFTFTELLGVEVEAEKPATTFEPASSPAEKPKKIPEVVTPTTEKTVIASEGTATKANKPAISPKAVKPAAGKPATPSKATKPATKKTAKADPDPLPLLKKAFEISVQENGWATLTALGQALKKLDPSFDSRTYGHSQLTKLLRAYPKLFEIDDTVANVRMKKSASK